MTALRGAATALALAFALAANAWGYEIEYGAARDPALAACDAGAYRGERAEAQGCYRALLAHEDVRIKAEAARALGDRRGANAYFQTAVREYPEDPAVRTRWGRLFLETHQDNDAAKLFQESLELDSAHVPAILGLAEISAERFDDRAREWAEQALDLEPESIAAHLLLARMNLEESAVEEADASLDRALELADARGIAPLEIYALKAASDLLRGIDESEWTDRALAYNPAFGDIYAVPAHFYVITRRYREAIELYRRAVEIQPDLYAAHAELGVNLLRENKVAQAQQHLALAYRGDPFSARTVNTLRLIDSFDNFVVTSFGKARDPASPEPGVILRLHEDEAPILEPYVLDLVNRSIEAYEARYGYRLEEPVIVELYPDHDDFAVRTSGLPGIGLLGVTFGYLVAMDSPSGRAEGDFHWGTTLWHEMAHVFTLEATNHLVPRWFSEGVSVYEEWSTGPLPGRHIPIDVFLAMDEDKFLPIAELDRGFIRPSYPSQVIVSYMQAGLICEYIAANWGQEALAAMLAGFRDGLETSAVVQAALGIAPEAFDARFAEFVAAEFNATIANLEPWRQAQRAAHESAASGRWSEAQAAAERAIEHFPDFVDQGSAYLIRAKAEEEAGARAAAVATLREYHARGGHDPAALLQLGRWLAEGGEADASIAVLEDALLVAPLNESLHADLGDRLLEAGRAEQALVEYEALFAMEPHDEAAAHLRLAKAHLQLEDTSLAREHLLYALEIAPHFREAQQLLLEIVR